MRGNRGFARFTFAIQRSIPACAGEPRLRSTDSAVKSVYPRVCGGTPRRPPLIAAACGLSPRVRGNPEEEIDLYRAERSIPACAGEPDEGAVHHLLVRVYPRVCGGTVFSSTDVVEKTGLSPRVRGNLGVNAIRVAVPGSIPACAGEPHHLRGVCLLSRVYPRVCGGTSSGLRPYRSLSGLSPRVRGNHARSLESS